MICLEIGFALSQVIKSKGRAMPFIRRGDDIDLVRFTVTTINHVGESCPSCINEIAFNDKIVAMVHSVSRNACQYAVKSARGRASLFLLRLDLLGVKF